MSGAGTSPLVKALALRLYIAGRAPNSVAAERHLRALLVLYPSVAVELEIVDLFEHPELGVAEAVIVTPTLIKVAPLPQRRITGTLKDTDALVVALGLPRGERA